MAGAYENQCRGRGGGWSFWFLIGNHVCVVGRVRRGAFPFKLNSKSIRRQLVDFVEIGTYTDPVGFFLVGKLILSLKFQLKKSLGLKR